LVLVVLVGSLDQVAYAERLLELFTDLLSQLHTRRFLRTVSRTLAYRSSARAFLRGPRNDLKPNEASRAAVFSRF
jgi:hypothetical protein